MTRPYHPEGLNKYAYSYDDPINYIDPDGLEPNPLEGYLEGLEWARGRVDAINRMLMAPQTPSKEEQKRQKELAKLAGKIDRALDKLQNTVTKEPCASFLNKLFEYAANNLQRSVNLPYANIQSVLGVAGTANYQVNPGKIGALITPGGIDVTQYFKDNPDSKAFVEQGFNSVYLRTGSGSNLDLTVLHEGFHVIFQGDAGQIIGLGMTDVDLAKAAGVYRNDKHASKDFNKELEKNCK